MAGNRRRTVRKAISIMKAHVQSASAAQPCRWTSPQRVELPYPRLWDSAIHSLGLKHISVDLAEDALRALFSNQREDGALAPTPESGGALVSHAPLASWVLWRHFESYRRTPFLREMYPKLVRLMAWFEANRRNENGLYGWKLAPDAVFPAAESGMNNSPRFDGLSSMTAVDLSSYMAAEYTVLEKMAKWLENASDAAKWGSRRREIVELMNELLWDDENTFYFDLDDAGDYIPIKTAAGFLALHGRVPDRDRAEALRMHLMNPKEFRTPIRVPSVSLNEDSFTNNMWRGPAWLNVNLFIYYGLMSYGFFQEAREIAHSSIDEVVRCYLLYGCFYEFYDASTDRAPVRSAPGNRHRRLPRLQRHRRRLPRPHPRGKITADRPKPQHDGAAVDSKRCEGKANGQVNAQLGESSPTEQVGPSPPRAPANASCAQNTPVPDHRTCMLV